MEENKITVTSPLLPNLDEFNEMLKEIWASKWITNNGQFHKQLEKALAEYLKVPYISLFTYSYFPIFVNEAEYGESRDSLYFRMKEQNVLGRRYFYPLISTFSTYRGLPSAAPANLPVATKIANEVICLPMHHELSEADLDRILSLIVK